MPLLNPRTQSWPDHFIWGNGSLRIEATTPAGAAVAALHLSDDPDAITVRSYWIMAGWHPPSE